MSRDNMELIFNNVVLACQLCLGLWQFCKLTPVGALIQGAFGWLLQPLGRPLGLSPVYSRLQHCRGRVFKKANCFALEADILEANIPPETCEENTMETCEENTIELNYLDKKYVLQRDSNMLYINQKMCYYITHRIWKKLQSLEQVLRYGLEGPPLARAVVAAADANRAAERAEAVVRSAELDSKRTDSMARIAGAEAERAEAERVKAEAKAELAEAEAERVKAEAKAELAEAEAERAKAKAERANAECLKAAVEPEAMAMLVEAESKAKAEAESKSKSKAAEAEFAGSIARSAATRVDEAMRAAKTYRAAADNASVAARAATNSAADKAALAADARAGIPALTAAADDARAVASAASSAATNRTATADLTLFVKGKKEFWKEVITGGVMTFEEVFDAIILYNKHVSRRLSNDWLLPVNLSVSEEKLLKIFNLVALFLQTKKANVHWLIPAAFSFIPALLEFSTGLRKWFYTKINELFCNIMHFICDPLPRSCRRQVYCLGKWVENLAPSNDLLVKVVRGKMCAIITEGAKVHKKNAILVPWLETDLISDYGIIEKQFRCYSKDIDIIMRCSYVIKHELCEISAPTICVTYVNCKSIEDFRHIVTLVSCVAENCCGSLVSCVAENCCGSLKCYSSNNKVCVRGFEESVVSYVNNGLPPIYKLELMNVIVAGRDASD